MYDSLGQYQESLNFHQQSLEIQREIGDLHGEANSLGNLGFAFMALNQNDNALKHFQQALTIFENLKLDHMAEKCKQEINELNQKKEKSLARKRLQKYGLWFVAGLALAFLLWYLKK